MTTGKPRTERHRQIVKKKLKLRLFPVRLNGYRNNPHLASASREFVLVTIFPRIPDTVKTKQRTKKGTHDRWIASEKRPVSGVR